MVLSKISTYDINKTGNNFNNDNVNKKSGFSFENYLKDALDKVNEMQVKSDKSSVLLATGNVENLHDAMIATEKARISLQLTLGIRNRIIESYKEIMRMQI